MLHRKSYARLLAWKGERNKKAMCFFGARQIGKTTLIRHFAKQEYPCFVEINFLEQPAATMIFAGDLDANTLITNLTAYTRQPLIPGKTLVFLDEIQACPQARTAIKFLVEDGRFDYIESGSLLGTRYRLPSYPVGFEEIHQMFPMDWEEFLLANGVQDKTLDYLHQCFERNLPVTTAVHQTLCKLFYTYLVVGGMPEAVQTYVTTHDIAKVIQIQKNILDLYRLDIAQYAEQADKVKIKAILDSIPSQLASPNRRFILTAVDPQGRQRRYADSFNWLADAGVAIPCYNVTEPQPPLTLNAKHNLFKLYMADTGLLCAACMDSIQLSLLNGDLAINMGSILENMMAQQLQANGFPLHYYNSKKNGELDFVIQNGTSIELIEVKSGKDYQTHSALDKILATPAWDFSQATVLCRDNLSCHGSIRYLPWYMILFMVPQKTPEHMIFNVDVSDLPT